VITRFIVKDSVEEKMLKIQDRKVPPLKIELRSEFRGELAGNEQGGEASCNDGGYKDIV
jgi:hypothetical protein